MLAREQPEDRWPSDGGGEEALHGAVAGAVTTPAGDTSHGHAAAHAQERYDDAAHLANGSRCQRWVETLEQC